MFLLNVRFPIRYADYVKIKQTSCLFSRSSQPERRVTWKQIIAVSYDECYHEYGGDTWSDQFCLGRFHRRGRACGQLDLREKRAFQVKAH